MHKSMMMTMMTMQAYSAALEQILKWEARTCQARSAGKIVCRAPPLFWLYKYNQSFW